MQEILNPRGCQPVETSRKWAFGISDSHNKVFGHPHGEGKLRAAPLYARVSTLDQQTFPLQSRAIWDYAARRGWSIVVQGREVGSGASDRDLREKVLDAARDLEIGRANEFPLDGNRGRRAPFNDDLR